MDIEAHRDLQLLEAVEQNARVTQRTLASKLGIALGLTNIYVKRLVRKGYIKCVAVPSNRISYLITPRGMAEKARLTYEFMEYSLHLYREVRRHLRAVVRACASDQHRFAIYGRGEAAELAYLSLRELGLEPTAIFDTTVGTFLGMPVHDVRDHASVAFDQLIVASLVLDDTLVGQLVEAGIDRSRLVMLRPQPAAPAAKSTDGRTPAAPTV